MKMKMKILNAFIAIAVLVSCRTVHKVSGKEYSASYSTVLAKKDSIVDIKIDGVAVHLGKDSIAYKIAEDYDNEETVETITEYQDGQVAKKTEKATKKSKGKKTDETIKTSSSFDSSAVQYIDHSAIKETLDFGDGTTSYEEHKEVKRKASAWKIAGGLILFTAFCVGVGIVFRHFKRRFL